MSGVDPDLLETVTPAAVGDGRRLTTLAKVKAALGISGSTYDTTITQSIDQVCDRAARLCGLAADSAGGFPTFGAETLRATWNAFGDPRDDVLLLPWRPAIAVTSVVEGGVALAVDADYRVADGWKLQRVIGGVPICWDPCLEVVIGLTAGWDLPDGSPPGLEGAVIDQVKYQFRARDRDPALRSEATQDVGSASWAVIGGDSISENGFLWSLERALDSYARIAV